MDDRIGNLSAMGFAESDNLLSGLGGDDVGVILMNSSDVVLIVDSEGQITDAGFASEEIFNGGGRGWRGRPVLEIVTSESHDKINELLDIARNGEFGPARQVNHPLVEADDLPVSYRATKLNDKGDVILLGQSTGQVASLQRRLMSSQLAMEREVSRLRNGESRYRAAFQLSQIPKIMVDAASLKILDVNTAAATLLGKSPQKIESKKVLSLFDDADSSVLHKLFLAAIDNQDHSEAEVRLSSGDEQNIKIATFRQDGKAHLLLSIGPASKTPSSMPNTNERRILSLIRNMPDAFVVTNSEMVVLTANRAFFDLLSIAGIGDIEGTELDRFFERPAVDCKVLTANVKEHGVVRRFASAMKTRYGQVVNVELAARQIALEDDVVLGFWIRPTNNIIMGAEVEQENVTRSNEQIANLVGHMPLKDIVRETTEMIEKLCIDTALELTKNNRASAAQMLGVSRQSLYSKLGAEKAKRT